MSTSSPNQNLQRAKAVSNDEFYTELSDIERELKHYKKHFKGKVVYCNCDDPRVSKFFYYFSHKFKELGLKRLITTCYKSQNANAFSLHNRKQAIWLEYTGEKNGERVPLAKDIGITPLTGDGDFRSPECVKLLKQADIVVTNPPFSLFHDYVTQLLKHRKKFVIIGSHNAITYKTIFKAIKDNKLWLGYGFAGGNAYFKTAASPEDFARGVYDCKTGLVKFRNVTWFTNLDISKRHESLSLYKKYNPQDYPTYDNYDAIEVSRVKDIPKDYTGAMGVPITFLDTYNPEQFEIICSDYNIKEGLFPKLVNPKWGGKLDRGYVSGRRKYARLLIKRKM